MRPGSAPRSARRNGLPGAPRHQAHQTAELVPGTLRVISVRMDYLPEAGEQSWNVIGDPTAAFISRYALGRDYHAYPPPPAGKPGRAHSRRDRRLRLSGVRGLRARAGKPWPKRRTGPIGKHTNLVNTKAGLLVLLGEIYSDLPLPPDPPLPGPLRTCRPA